MFSGLENPTHLLLVFLVVLLVFGAKRLPEIGRGIGSGMRGFKDALTAPEPPNTMLNTAQAPRDEQLSRGAEAPHTHEPSLHNAPRATSC